MEQDVRVVVGKVADQSRSEIIRHDAEENPLLFKWEAHHYASSGRGIKLLQQRDRAVPVPLGHHFA